MADVKAEVTRVALNTSTGTQDITISGFGTPKAAIVELTIASVDDAITAHYGQCIGFTDGSTDVSTLARGVDNVATSDTGRRTSTTVLGILYDSTSTLVSSMVFSSWITDGIRINITDSNGAAAFIKVTLIGGADTINVKAKSLQMTATTVVESALTFEPDLVIITGSGNSVVDSLGAQCIQSIGFAHNNGADANFGSFHWDRDAQTTTNTGCYVSTSRCCGQVFNDAATWLGLIDTYTTSGFTVRTTASPGNDYVVYLALQFQNSPDIKIFSTDGPTATGSKAFTDPGFKPDFLTLITSGATATDTVQGAGPDGLASYTTDGTSEYALAISSDDAAGTTVAKSIAASKLKDLQNGSGVLHDGTFTSFDATGFTFNFTTAPGTARKWIGLAIGSAVAGSAIPVILNSYRQRRNH